MSAHKDTLLRNTFLKIRHLTAYFRIFCGYFSPNFETSQNSSALVKFSKRDFQSSGTSAQEGITFLQYTRTPVIELYHSSLRVISLVCRNVLKFWKTVKFTSKHSCTLTFEPTLKCQHFNFLFRRTFPCIPNVQIQKYVRKVCRFLYPAFISQFASKFKTIYR